MRPSIGRIVLVTLTAQLAKQIGGNAQEGDQAPAVVTCVFSDTCVNARIFGDGPNGSVWVTSVVRGTGPREWDWPARIAENPVASTAIPWSSPTPPTPAEAAARSGDVGAGDHIGPEV